MLNTMSIAFPVLQVISSKVALTLALAQLPLISPFESSFKKEMP